jgi:hypothetical protein
MTLWVMNRRAAFELARQVHPYKRTPIGERAGRVQDDDGNATGCYLGDRFRCYFFGREGGR